MSDWTPSTEDVREAYAETGEGLDFKRVAQERREAFDAWIQAERARIWDEGYVAGSLHGLGPLALDNPYRTEKQ